MWMRFDHKERLPSNGGEPQSAHDGSHRCIPRFESAVACVGRHWGHHTVVCDEQNLIPGRHQLSLQKQREQGGPGPRERVHISGSRHDGPAERMSHEKGLPSVCFGCCGTGNKAVHVPGDQVVGAVLQRITTRGTERDPVACAQVEQHRACKGASRAGLIVVHILLEQLNKGNPRHWGLVCRDLVDEVM